MELLPERSPLSGDPAEITRFVVRTMAATLGRGPTRARAYVNEDVITVVLRDTLTKPEQVLIEHGSTDALQIARGALHDAMRIQLREGIERVTDRPVLSLHIDHQFEADTVAIVFVLVQHSST